MRVLIIDDEKIIRDATRIMVQDAGHQGESVGNAAAAMEQLRQTPFDLVLLDVQLGQTNGLDVLRDVLLLRPGVPVLMFTAQAAAPLAEESKRRGAFDIVEKPLTKAQLESILARVQMSPQAG